MTGILELRDFCLYAFKHPKVKMAAWAALVLSALNLAALVLAWGPAAYRHHQLVKTIEEGRRARLESNQALEFSRRYQELLKRAAALEAKWDTPASQSSLIESLERLAAKNGLRVLSQDFSVGTAKKAGQSLEEDISLEGPYPAFRHFLADLENLKTLTVVEDARLERAGEHAGQVRALLKLGTYHRTFSGKRP